MRGVEMARTKKVKDAPSTEVVQPETVDLPEVIQETPTVTVEVKDEVTKLILETPIANPTERFISEQMDKAYKEILRCDDYIQAMADADRIFATYRRELYEYRYKLRQLKFDPNYPSLDKLKLPDFPTYVKDQ